MASSKEIVCFQCGLEVSTPPALNRLPSGEVCSSCRERLLESLPAPFPTLSPVSMEPDSEETEMAEVQYEGHSPGGGPSLPDEPA